MDLVKLLSNRHNESFYGLPIIDPVYSQMCLSFIYFLNGTSNDIDLNLYVIQNKIKFNLIWTETTHNSPFWKKAYIDINTSSKFQIALQVLATNRMINNSNILNNLIAVDNFKIVYGYCVKANNKIIENNKFFLKTSPFTNSDGYIKQRLKRSDNDYVQDTCGGVYNLKFGKSLIIQNPGYPFSYEFNKKCVYLIKVI